MIRESVKIRVRSVVLMSAGAITVTVTPWLNMDPIGLPKLSILLVASLFLAGTLISSYKSLIPDMASPWRFAILIFISSLIAAFFFSNQGLISQAYGAFGRNTGFLAYLSLALLLWAVCEVSDYRFIGKLLWVLIFSASFNCLYGLIQFFSFDPIDWSNPYNRIVGTLGNPNFTSAFLGIAALASLAFLLEKHTKKAIKIFLVLEISTSIFLIYHSDSSQGLLIFILGSLITLYFRYVRISSIRLLKPSYLSSVFLSVFFGLLGVINKGPLAPHLYQDSVTFRGDYWRAGWNMTVANPVFGVGMDGYGDWYRYFRTEEAVSRRGPDIISNSAHNVLLDISSSGGFTLLIAYVLLISLILRSAIRVLRSSISFDPLALGLVSSWSAYQIQSLISINQLGLATWGWILGGAILGYDASLRNKNIAEKVELTKQVPASVIISGFLSLIAAIGIAAWPISKDAIFRSAIQSGNAASIDRSAALFPENTYYYVYLAEIYLANKFYDRAILAAEKAIEINPREFNAWKVLYAIPTLSDPKKAEALSTMRILDPLNNSLIK